MVRILPLAVLALVGFLLYQGLIVVAVPGLSSPQPPPQPKPLDFLRDLGEALKLTPPPPPKPTVADEVKTLANNFIHSETGLLVTAIVVVLGLVLIVGKLALD